MTLDSASIRQRGNKTRFCWLGGDTPNMKPQNWNAPWFLHVAHIASGRGKAFRADDRRAVILLSPLAHEVHVSNSDKLTSKTIGGELIPTIDERHTLFLKAKFDPEYYDPEFLQSIWVGKLPEPERPPQWWVDRMARNQGIIL